MEASLDIERGDRTPRSLNRLDVRLLGWSLPGLALTLVLSLATAGCAGRSTTPAPAPPIAEITPAKVRLTPEEQRQLESLYRLGIQASAESRHDDAIRYWEIVWASDPDHADVAERLKQEYLARGMESWASNDVDAAIESWKAVLRIDPRNTRAHGYLRRAYDQDTRLKQITRDREVAESDD